MYIDLSHKTPVPLQPFIKHIQLKSAAGWRLGVRLLNHHTDAISSVGILAITTCLLAAKIFPSIPSIIPRCARMVLNFGGIIWLNVQIRDFFKSGRDLWRAAREGEKIALIETAAKVFVKGVNVLLTCAYFSASVIAFGGFPVVSSMIYSGLRPLGLLSLSMGVTMDIRDYFTNEALLRKLNGIENEITASRKLAQIMCNYLSILVAERGLHGLSLDKQTKEYKLSSQLVRQLDMHTLETFQDNLFNRDTKDPRSEAIRLYYAVKDSVINKQDGTKSNISLMALGYVSMAICRLYPDSLIEMCARWGMSVLYTDEMIRYKLFQWDLAAALSDSSLSE